MQEYIKNIKRNAAIGLWGSVGVVIVAAVLTYALHPSVGGTSWMVVAGTVLAVLAVSMMMLSVRRHTRPRTVHDHAGGGSHTLRFHIR